MAVLLTIKVVPGASRSKIVYDPASKQIKCSVTAPPVEGKANKAVIELLAKVSGIPRRQISIIRGESARLKTIAFETALSRDELFKRLGIEHQESLF